MSVFSERIRACPRFAQRLRRYPFDLGAPQWVDDPDFDIARHVRRVALPHPGDDDALYRLVADVMGRRLDRDRPLWELWVIEGLAGERWAMLTKVHHCMADGIAATHILTGLCDRDGGGAADGSARCRAAQRPKTAAARPRSGLSGLWNAPAAIASGVVRLAQGSGELVTGLLTPVASALTGPLSDLRRFSGARVPMADLELVCETFDVTINDVALAAITESYRNVLLARASSRSRVRCEHWCRFRCGPTTPSTRPTIGSRRCCRTCPWTRRIRFSGCARCMPGWGKPRPAASPEPETCSYLWLIASRSH
ncbi:putative diacylglycerol O-acyltransferase tgs1 [Mycobacterium ulcerans str. Harvey]|uniref:diacylglycerol O-acyltransferase n=1 Tax=Mycobacterium ulcerans str. Harvey TaxID=1299332 RepID=A0ABN0QYM7_MYCUL|nr:putative diacylglycerol O-acyltransferase tgs1 [Mycobacterium ulcerans str. Harvey]